jgi:hypothetical protein
MTSGFEEKRAPLSRLFIPGPRRVPRELLVLCFLLTLILPVSGLADEVRLRNGNVLDGTIVDRSDAQIVLEHPDLGRLTVPTDAIDSVSETGAAENRPTGQTAAASSEGSEDHEEIAQNQEGDHAKASGSTDAEGKWNLGLVFGGSATNDDEGEKTSVNARGRADRKRPGSETTVSLSYIYKLNKGEVDDNNLTGILHQLWPKEESPWFYLVNARYDYDSFRSWRQRIQAQGGAGYRFIDEEKLRLRPFAGLGFRKDIDSQEEAFPIEAVAGMDFALGHEDRQHLDLTAMYFRALTDNEYRFVNTLEWKVPILRKGRVSFNIHLDYEYASEPDPGFPHNNYSLTWGLQWDF